MLNVSLLNFDKVIYTTITSPINSKMSSFCTGKLKSYFTYIHTQDTRHKTQE